MLTTGVWWNPVSNMLVAPCVNDVGWRLGTRGLRMVYRTLSPLQIQTNKIIIRCPAYHGFQSSSSHVLQS